MPNGPSDVVLKDLRTLFQVGTAAGLTDGQLIEQFLSQPDDAGEAAFRALVTRHAPMVLRICREIVGDWHEAEDASQATFIVLAEKAGSIRKRDSVASWLFGVACRVAAQARAKASRRRRHEERSAELLRTEIAQKDWRMTLLELYEEVDRLPELLRGPLVLCHLQGYTQPQAAARLGCPLRTLQNRLARGHKRLESRLTRRGLYPAVGLWEPSTGPIGTSAPISVAWLEKTVRAAVASTGQASTAGMVSASVAALTEGMLSIMFQTRLKTIVARVVAAGVLTAGISLLAVKTGGAPPRDEKTSGPSKPAPHVSVPEIIVRAVHFSRDRREEGFAGIAAIDPGTGKWRPIYRGLALGFGRISPDHRYFVYSSLGGELPDNEVGVWVYDMTGKAPARRIFDRKGEPFWTNNGRQVVFGTPVDEKHEKFETWSVNADGTGPTRLPIPDTDLVLDCSGDGKWLATRTMSGEPRHRGRLTLVHPDGTGARYLTEGSANDDLFSIFKISPDGRSVAYVEIKTVDDIRHARLYIVDIDGTNRREISIAFEPDTTVVVNWSPDGSLLALNAINGKTKEGSIALVDRDGSNYRQLPLPPGRWFLHVCDWTTISPDLRVGAPNDTPDLKTPRGRYQALVLEIKKAAKIHAEASRKARSSEERSRIYRERFPHARLYAGRFLEIAELAPDDPAAIDALIRVVTFGVDGPEFSRAIDLLADRHAESRAVGHAALTLTGKASPAVEKLIRAVVEKNSDQYINGLACLALGRYLEHQSDRVRDIREDPDAAKAWEAIFLEEGSGKESFAQFSSRDPDAMMKEAEAILERTVKEFGGLTSQGDRLSKHAFTELVTDANAELDEIRNLCTGKPAPEIAGEDIDGKPFKLSDYRGNVVYLSFWADWCGSCRAMLPLERSLVTRMQGKSFVLLGVNGDGDKKELRELMKREHINWRSWCDGGGDANNPGPIARQYHVSSWPTVYLIDDRGVIRHKMLGDPASKKFNSEIDALVAAAQSRGNSATARQ